VPKRHGIEWDEENCVWKKEEPSWRICEAAYRDRGLHDPVCRHDVTEDLEARLATYEFELSKEMPKDYKDWWQNSKTEWPLVARLVLEVRRERMERAEEAEGKLLARAERAEARLRDLFNAMTQAAHLIANPDMGGLHLDKAIKCLKEAQRADMKTARAGGEEEK
jgi:hypothetical protein